MKNNKIFAVILLTFALLLTACSNESKESTSSTEQPTTSTTTTEGSSEEKGTFKVGMEAAYPPFNWTQMDDGNGGVPIEGNPEFAGGYDVEIAKKIAEGLGKELVIVKTEWTGLVPAVQSGKIDAIIGGMSPTDERKEQIDFSDVYYESDLVIVVKKGSPYEKATSLEDFKGAKITGQLGTFHYTVVEQIPGVVKEVAQDDFNAMRVALVAGAIDGYVSERPEGVSATSANSELAYVTFEEGKGFETDPAETAIAVGLVKDSPLKEDINKIIAGIPKEERLSIMDQAIANQPAQEE